MPPISPMQTVSLMSGTSQPIPAHFVLMRSRHSLKQKVRNSISHRANQPSPQPIHDSFFLVPGVVTTELLDLRGAEVVEAKGIYPLLGPLRYDSSDQVTIVKIEKFLVPIFYCITQDVSCVKTEFEITPQFRPQQWFKQSAPSCNIARILKTVSSR